MKLFFCLLFTSSVLTSLHAQKGENFYMYKEDWSPAKEIDSARFIMSSFKENDTLYICRYYNIYGPLISWESYKDAAFQIPNGKFVWYNLKGEIDSARSFLNGKPLPRWSDMGKGIQSSSAYSKKISDNNNESDRPHDINFTDSAAAYQPAQFEGGLKSWTRFMEKSFIVPERLQKLTTGSAKYTVVASFIIDKQGDLSNILIEKSCELSFDSECIRVLKKSPRWIPATYKGMPVVYRHKLTFHQDFN